MPAHKHAALMLQYANDAAEIDQPAARWEFKRKDADKWTACSSSASPSWVLDYEYRRKPPTVKIGDREVPVGEKVPLTFNTTYYTPHLTSSSQCSRDSWNDDVTDRNSLTGGLVHLDMEHARQHTLALLALTKKGS